MDLRSLFYKRYANIPISLRSEIIVVVNNDTLTWNSLKIEVDSDTEIASKALIILNKIGVLVEDTKHE